jgi:gluconokinase
MVIVIMGTTGAGKTTIGKLLATQLAWEFVDADDFHPSANVEKMTRGIPLTDADRAPWLDSLHYKIVIWLARKQNVVLACSALKQAYRDMLLVGPEVKLVYLKGSQNLLRKRLVARKGHFAGESLLASQFADLQEPTDAVTVDAGQWPKEIVAEIRRQLSLN